MLLSDTHRVARAAVEDTRTSGLPPENPKWAPHIHMLDGDRGLKLMACTDETVRESYEKLDERVVLAPLIVRTKAAGSTEAPNSLDAFDMMQVSETHSVCEEADCPIRIPPEYDARPRARPITLMSTLSELGQFVLVTEDKFLPTSL